MQAYIPVSAAVTPLPLAPDSNSDSFPIAEAHAAIDQLAALLDLYKKHPSLIAGGEIRVVTDRLEIEAIEEEMEKRFLEKGVSAELAFLSSRVGIVSQGQFFLQLRDAVVFPNGNKGLYERQLERSALEGGGQGAVVLPLQPDGKILFNLTFRHATRDWGMELARGFSKRGEPPIQTSRRELKEETGMDTEDPISLGEVVANTGAGGTKPSIFLCRLNGEGAHNRGDEAIKKCIPFSPQEVADALVNGYFIHEGTKVPFIDGFSMNAIVKAVAFGHIELPVGRKWEVV